MTNQDCLYEVPNNQLHIPESAILNVAILRDENFRCRLGPIILSLTKESIIDLSSHFELRQVVYSSKKCALSHSDFKLYNQDDNSGFYGCIYNPTYYRVITTQKPQHFHTFGQDIEKEVSKI